MPKHNALHLQKEGEAGPEAAVDAVLHLGAGYQAAACAVDEHDEGNHAVFLTIEHGEDGDGDNTHSEKQEMDGKGDPSVVGCTSPKPTVVTVAEAKYTDCGNGAIGGAAAGTGVRTIGRRRGQVVARRAGQYSRR